MAADYACDTQLICWADVRSPRHRGGFRGAFSVAAFGILAVGAVSRGRSQLALCKEGAERVHVQVTPRSSEAASRFPSLPGLLSYCPVS